ncbi:MAG: hypothetical protein IJ270_07525 [Paludibacteraceae bacterium]|nr:hypothetical protein [Paludibacteraceae bacterium]
MKHLRYILATLLMLLSYSVIVPKDYSKYLGPTIDNFDYLFWDKMD